MVKTVMHISSTIYSDVLSTENCEEKRRLELLYLSDEILDCRIHLSIRLTFLGNLVVSMNDGGMVSVPHLLSDSLQGDISIFPAQIHTDLPRICDLLILLLGKNIRYSDIKML